MKERIIAQVSARYARTAAALLVLTLFSVPVQGATYDLVYSAIVGGASRSTAGSGSNAVEIVSMSTMDGVVASGASVSYQLEPVVASSDTNQSTVADWSLY